MFWEVGGRKGVRQRKVSDVSGPKCGGCSTEGLRAWEQERGKKEMRHQRQRLHRPQITRMFKLFKMTGHNKIISGDEGDHREEDKQYMMVMILLQLLKMMMVMFEAFALSRDDLHLWSAQSLKECCSRSSG